MLRTKLRIEPETDLGLYLGCMLTRGESKLHDGTVVNTVSYNMEGLLKLSVEKYLDIVGHDTKLKKVRDTKRPRRNQISSRTSTRSRERGRYVSMVCQHL